ncbi:MAG: hypothetical protein U0469_02380 [Candidatus Paceibacterota bacterium]
MFRESFLKSESPEVLVRKFDHLMSTHQKGTISDVSKILRTPNTELEKLIKNLPKRASELKDISKVSEVTQKTFNSVVKHSFNYLRSIIDHELAASADRSDLTWYKLELKDKDTARTLSHNATMSAIDIWMRSLVKAGVDIRFLTEKIRKGDRYSYGDFAVGLALDIFTSKNPLDYTVKTAKK